jgi:hypothetical protein
MSKSPTERVAEEVRVVMARRRVSGASLANTIGVSQSRLSRRLTGNTDFTVGELSKVSRALEVDLVIELREPSGDEAA